MDADGQVARVEFYDGSTKLGEDTTPPYSLALSNVTAGDHWLSARAIDDAYASTTSIPVLITGLGSVPFVVSPWGASWRYRDNGSAPAANWTQLPYDDSGWKTGAAEIGYGDFDEMTVAEDNPTPGYNSSDTNRYITTWFRRTFTITNVAQITALAGRMIRDDGVAVYLNGTDIWRDNLAVGAGPTTPALNGISGTAETTQITKTLNPANLVEGTNVLAVEIHQIAADSSDISFNLELIAERPATAPNPDTDGDGMRDIWEMAHGFNYANAADAGLDADGDGTSNLSESRLGLDPRDAAQVFRATLAPGFTLSWPSAAGLTFTIERSATLTPANWTSIGTVNGTGPTATFTDATPLPNGGFYRVRLSP
jgi:hypothetical protein